MLDRFAYFSGRLTGHLPRKLILCYHSISSNELVRDYFRKNQYVSPRSGLNIKRIEEQLKWLQSFADFVTLDEITEFQEPLKDQERWKIAITFDDGYYNNIALGLPLFKKYSVPVTIFAATKFIENQRFLPWWDLLNFIAESIDNSLNLKYSKKHYRYDLAKEREKQKFWREQRSYFLSLTRGELTSSYKVLKKEAQKYIELPKNAFATKRELIDLSTEPLVSIGGHTHSHINMGVNNADIIREEVKKGMNKLKKWTGHSPRWFAYPYGGIDHFDIESIEIVKSLGFRGAVTTNAGYLSESYDQFMISRLAVQSHWDIEAFKSHVVGLFYWNRIRELKSGIKTLIGR